MPRVVVLGSINQDIVTTVVRHAAQNETVFASSLKYFPGGRGANQSVAACSAGADTVLIGAIGNDAPGRMMLDFLRSKDVDVKHIRRLDVAPTGLAIVVVDRRGRNRVVVVSGANEFVLDDPTVELVPDDTLLSQFEVPDASIIEFFSRGKEAGCTTILNPGPARAIPDELLAVTDVCVVNEEELAAITGVSLQHDSDLTSITEAAQNLCSLSDALRIVVKLGSRGAMLVSCRDFEAVTGQDVTVVDATGAGDVFVGSMAARLAAGDKLSDALSYANRASSISAKHLGAGNSVPSQEQVRAFTA